MKIPTLKNLLALLLIAAASTSLADESKPTAEQWSKAFQAATPIPKEQSGKVIVSFKLNSPESEGDTGIKFQLHNGLPDSVVAGIVFTVTSKDPVSGKERSLDYVGYCDDGLPLKVSEGWVPLFRPFEGVPRNSVVTIKEIRVRPIAG